MPISPTEKLKKGDSKLALKVQDKYKSSLQNKREMQAAWRVQKAFVDGDQYVNLRTGTAPRKAPSYRVRITHNVCAPLVNTAVAKLTQQEPGWRVRPRGTDSKRVSAARAGDLLLKYQYQSSGLLSALEGAVLWACICGTGFIHRSWDQFKKRSILKAIGPQDVFLDYSATSWPHVTWTVLVHTLTLEDIESWWQGKSDLIRQGDEESEDYRRELKGYSASSQKTFTVLEYEEIPNATNPEGVRAFVCDNVTLYKGPLPNGRLALSCMRVGVQPGRLWGTGYIKNIIDIQREINRTLSQAIELRNQATNPPWVYARGSVPKNVDMSAPNARIPYNPNLGARPERLTPVPIPASLLMLVEHLEGAAQDSAGVHDVSQGRGPSGVISGKAMGTLADQDSTKLGPAVREIELMLSDVGGGMLEDWRDHNDEETTISTLGPGRVPEVVEFHRAMLGDGPIDVDVLPGSMLPRHPSHQADLALQMFQLGALDVDPAMAIIKVQEALGVYGLQNVIGDDSPDRIEARKENHHLSNPEISHLTQVSWTDAHVTHIHEHLKRLKESDLTDEERTALEEHIASHYEQLMFQEMGLPTYQQAFGVDIKQMAQMQSAQQQGGQPGPPAAPQEAPRLGGGTPELNGAVGPEGPGVEQFDTGA